LEQAKKGAELVSATDATTCSRVGVKITIDGKTQEVWSDSYHIGTKSGLQARFVEAAAAIDKAVGTDQWVKCDEGLCGN
jgi:hypothetical protein